MIPHLVVVDSVRDWHADFPHAEVVVAEDYIAQPQYFEMKNARVINLCRSYRYLGMGYYCSLLAEARQHKVIPTVRTIQDLSSRSIYSLGVDDLDELLQKSLKRSPATITYTGFETLILFGQTLEPRLQELGRQLFELFRCPILKVEFRRQEKKWRITSLKAVNLASLPDEQRPFFSETFHAYNRRRWTRPRSKSTYRYDLALLWNPEEKLAPSNRKAVQSFVRIGRSLGLDVDVITRDDYTSLAEYDGLFIRETTAINHYTYRFATKAESEGLVVIDDPNSILKCTNKVYLAELLKAHRVPTPKTLILRKGEVMDIEAQIAYTVVLKIPDGSFSRGIFKANDRAELEQYTAQLFKDSDLILAQEYVYTEFDWRIGILNRQPLFACQYFMSKKHWQIVKHDQSGKVSVGAHKAWRVADVPNKVLRAAQRAANLIGDGLYGVDVKETEAGAFVMEVNDNPNIDAGVEDSCLGDALYEAVCGEFLRRLDARGRRRRRADSG